MISGPWFVAEMDRPIAAAVLPWVSEAGAPATPYLTVDAAFVATQAAAPQSARRFARWLAGPDGAEVRQRVGRQAVTHSAIQPDDALLRVLATQAEHAVAIPSDPDIANVFEAQARGAAGRAAGGGVAPGRGPGRGDHPRRAVPSGPRRRVPVALRRPDGPGGDRAVDLARRPRWPIRSTARACGPTVATMPG